MSNPNGTTPTSGAAGDPAASPRGANPTIIRPSEDSYQTFLHSFYFHNAQMSAYQNTQNYNIALSLYQTGTPTTPSAAVPPPVPPANIFHSYATTPAAPAVMSTTHGNSFAFASSPPPATPATSAAKNTDDTAPAPAPTEMDEKRVWPDGNFSFDVPESHLMQSGMPYFGWTLVHMKTKRGANTNVVKRTFYCLGVYKCAICAFVAKPQQPKSKRFGAPGKTPRYVCINHPTQPLEWLACTGGPTLHQKTKPSTANQSLLVSASSPCILTTFETKDPSGVGASSWRVVHEGTHNHPKPPVTKPSPAAMQELEKIVKREPKVGPAKLRMGTPARPPVTELSDAFVNQDHLTLKPHGIRGSLASFIELNHDLPQEFFTKIDLTSKDANVIIMQSPYMKQVLNEAAGGLQADTVEGVLFEQEYRHGPVDIHFISAFEEKLQRWVPVLMAIIFGRTKKHYAATWMALFESYEGVKNWESFHSKFTGVTLDWSQALGISFLEAVVEFAHEKLHDTSVTQEEALGMLQLCEVHFARSVNRIKRNAAIVPPKMEEDFATHMSRMQEPNRSFSSFCSNCSFMARKFPNCVKWLIWHLHPLRAPAFSPACKTKSEKEIEGIPKTILKASSTNAQENLGKQFQEFYDTPMTINEAVLNAWKFQAYFSRDRGNVESGLPVKYNEYPRLLDPNKKRKQAVNDGRGPDTNQRIFGSRKARAAAIGHLPVDLDDEDRNQPDEADTLFMGPKWQIPGVATNTCVLDSFLVLLFVPWFGKLNLTPYPELADNESLLSRTFKLLESNECADARILWLEEFFKLEIGKRKIDLWRDSDCLFKEQGIVETSRVRGGAGHPLLQSFQLLFIKNTKCMREGKCKKFDTSRTHIPHEDDSDVEEVPREERKLELQEEQIRSVKRAAMKTSAPGYTDKSKQMTVEECLNEKLQPKTLITTCYIDRECEGPTWTLEPEIIKWPHTLVFDCPGRKLEELPSIFYCKGKKFVLRGAMVCGFGHWCSVIRCPFGWMHYDGMKNAGERFEFFQFGAERDAVKGRVLNIVTYEVLEVSETRNFQDERLDWSKIVASRDVYQLPGRMTASAAAKKVVDMLEDSSEEENAGASMKNKLGTLKTKIKQEGEKSSSSKKKGTTPAKKTRKAKVAKGVKTSSTVRVSSRIPKGISVRVYDQRGGPNAKCKGCGKDILKTQPAVRNSHKKFKFHEHPTIEQYHCKADCFKKLKPKDKEDLKKKCLEDKWTNKQMLEILKEIEKL